MTQRDKMRELYHQHHGDKEAVIEAYAEAEKAGEVSRQRNASGYGTKQYAQALWNDGEKKGWLVQNKVPRLVAEATIKPTSKTTGRPLRAFDHIPDTVFLLYNEAVQAVNGEMYVSCAAVLRAMIEAICADKGIVEGPVAYQTGRRKNLEGKINGLLEAGLIIQDHANVLHPIRNLGNDSLHEGVAFDRRLLETAVEIMEHLIYVVYELPNKSILFPVKAK